MRIFFLKLPSFLLLIYFTFGIFFDSFHLNYLTWPGIGRLSKVDADGIPTLVDNNWIRLIEKQGFVHAAERLWQMDLARKAGEGTLSQWFGIKTINIDIKRKKENWFSLANEAVEDLTPQDSQACDAYARGINRFIQLFPSKKGIEYFLLGAQPKVWTCRDSILVALNLVESLTSSSDLEWDRQKWADALEPSWFQFLFPSNHPLLEKNFAGEKLELTLPSPKPSIPDSKITSADFKETGIRSIYSKGSNAWVYRNSFGAPLIASDPHIANRVPQTWFAQRLRKSNTEWLAGVSLPGVPSILIGQNENLAWTFTNQGDDVDDFLKEQVDENKENYLAELKDGNEIWKSIRKKKFSIAVKGEKTVEVESWYTHRGPLYCDRQGFEGCYSRQWLALKKGTLGLPTLALSRSRNWARFNKNLDRFIAPSQSALYADKFGNIGFRATGAELIQSENCGRLQAWNHGLWQKPNEKQEKLRIYLPRELEENETKFLVNANEQKWSHVCPDRWANPDRFLRISEILAKKQSERSVSSLAFHKEIQLDDLSRFHQRIFHWVLDSIDLERVAMSTNSKIFMNSWRNWSGHAAQNPQIFAAGLLIEDLLLQFIINRVKNTFLPPQEKDVFIYRHSLDRAVLDNLMSDPGLIRSLGTDEIHLKEELLNQFQKLWFANRFNKYKSAYPLRNRWSSQHPFYHALPIIGLFFKVREIDQLGYTDLVRVETPSHGASMRMLVKFSDPLRGIWSFPVGQSGHPGTRFYRNWQLLWQRGSYKPILDKSYIWH